MPFLRSVNQPVARARAVMIAMMAAAALVAAAASPAQAELAPAPQVVDDAVPVRALPPAFAPDAATFCPRPTGRWWDDYAALGCVELLSGRDHTTPITERELAWLDLGALPAYATVDPDAIDAAIAAFVQRLAEEAAEAAAAEQAARDAAAAARRVASRAPARSAGRSVPGQPYSDAEIARVLDRCGYHSPHPEGISSTEMFEREQQTQRCIEENLPGYFDWLAAEERRTYGIPEPEPFDADAAAAAHERWVADMREAEAREAARADQFNPELVAGAIANLSAGNDSVTVGLYGDLTRVRADVRTIGEACFTSRGSNHYSTWIDGASHRTPTYRATVTCLWIAP